MYDPNIDTLELQNSDGNTLTNVIKNPVHFALDFRQHVPSLRALRGIGCSRIRAHDVAPNVGILPMLYLM